MKAGSNCSDIFFPFPTAAGDSHQSAWRTKAVPYHVITLMAFSPSYTESKSSAETYSNTRRWTILKTFPQFYHLFRVRHSSEILQSQTYRIAQGWLFTYTEWPLSIVSQAARWLKVGQTKSTSRGLRLRTCKEASSYLPGTILFNEALLQGETNAC